MSRNYEDCPSARVVDVLREAQKLRNSRAYVMHEIGAGNDEELWEMMADAIEASYRPIPLMEDGYPISVGTETKYGKIERFEVYEDGDWLIRFEGDGILEGTYSQRVELPDTMERLRDDMRYHVRDGAYPDASFSFIEECADRLTALMERGAR